MSNSSSTKVGVSKSWSLIEFARKFGQMKVTNELVNTLTGEAFKSCAFINEGKVTLVGFSSKLTTINPDDDPKVISRQISAQKDQLQVVQLESGNYKLCQVGTDNWVSVDLG